MGERYDIVWGELVRNDESGLLEVVDTPGIHNTIHNDIIYSRDWIGKTYTIRHSDCVTLIAEYLDVKYGTDYLRQYSTMRNREFVVYLQQGIRAWFDEHEDFSIIEDFTQRQVDDIIIYDMLDKVDYIDNTHIGIVLEDDKILHHVPNRLSSVDAIEEDRIVGVYRNANA